MWKIEGFTGNTCIPGRRSVLAVTMTMLMLAVACGSGSQPVASGSGANVSEAQRLVQQAEQPIASWKPAGSAFDVSKARGKSIWFISDGLTFPFEQAVFTGLKQSAAAVGATATGFDSKASI